MATTTTAVGDEQTRPWDEPERVLRTWEVSTHLGVDQDTVYRLLNSGALRGLKIGRQWRVPVSALNEYISGGGAHSAA